MMKEKNQKKLPEGTVTFLFTDIEGSTRLLHRLGDQYDTLLTDQRWILREEFKRWGGQEIDTQGDSFFACFQKASDAVAAAADIQQIIADHSWPEGIELRLRMGLHTGEPLVAQESYIGIDVHRAARVAALGHGGQVLLSETTAALVCDQLPEGVSLKALGEYRLKDFDRPEPVSQLVIPGLLAEFPALKSPGVRPIRLPTPSTPFIGRRSELEELSELINSPEVRLVTILAPGRSRRLKSNDEISTPKPFAWITCRHSNLPLHGHREFDPYTKRVGRRVCRSIGGSVEQPERGISEVGQSLELWSTVEEVLRELEGFIKCT
jgi:class 3 adenylate cyclase